MKSVAQNSSLPVSPDLLEILRDPYAIQQGDKYGPDPGRLELVHGCWLASADTGYKYPIRDGIPVMLIEEGARWKDTPVEQLPVPPPAAQPSASPPAVDAGQEAAADSGFRLAIIIIGGLVLIGLLLFVGRRRAGRNAPTAP